METRDLGNTQGLFFNRTAKEMKTMETYIDIMRQMRGLSETCSQAVQYIHVKFEKGVFEQAEFLLLDLVEAVCALEQGLQLLAGWLNHQHLLGLLHHFSDALVSVVAGYEQQEWHLLTGLVARVFVPRYDEWKKELDRSLDDYLLS